MAGSVRRGRDVAYEASFERLCDGTLGGRVPWVQPHPDSISWKDEFS